MRHSPILISIVLLGGAITAQPKPPVAKTISWEDSIHGRVRSDEYRWLRDKANPEVIVYLKAENAYTNAVMNRTRPLQRRLYREFRARIQETALSVPVKLDSFYYYERTVKGKDYSIYCRRRGGPKAAEEVMLDENALARGHSYFSIDGTFISPDHSILAYLADTTGAFTYTIYFKDLKSGKLLPDSITSAKYLAWANDNRTVFYEGYDESQRSDRVFRHRLLSPPDSDRLVYKENDPEFSVSLQRTRSRKHVIIYSASKSTSEARVGDADAPDGTFRLFKPRLPGYEYYLDHHGDKFYIVTNDSAVNFRLMEAPVADPARANWTELIPARDSVLIEDVLMFREYCVVQERIHGLAQLRVRSWDGAADTYVRFSEPAYTVHAWRNHDYTSDRLRYTYSSMVSPGTVYEYGMGTGTYEVLKRYPVLGGFDQRRYASERIYATATDGATVPISLVYKKGLKRDGRNPCLLEGYGAYGDSWDPGFSSNRMSLLDRGFVCAIAHVRGGQELGRRWYQDGKVMNKKNTFTDFIACAEQLIAGKYTSPQRLIISGGSAGGLLMGAVVNTRPELFKAAVMDVPFVDMINTMLDPTIPLTTAEYEEWGDPRVKEQYEYMASYAPYENIRRQAYPAMLVTTGLNDANVPFWEPAKWTARLRRLKTDDHTLLLKINLSSGHGGPPGRYGYMKDLAFSYAFMLDVLGIKQ